MIKIATCILRLPDERLVLQRRDEHAPTSPNQLSFFGGRLEDGETPIVAMKRELGEETSLDVGKIAIKKIAKLKISGPQDPVALNVIAYLFLACVPNADFDVFEGVGSEVYTFDELRARDDLSHVTLQLVDKVSSMTGIL